MEPQIKAAGYVRVSTTQQAKEGESLTTQREQVKSFAKQKGWQLSTIYADEGITGTKIKYRTQFQQMIKDAEQGMFDVIVFTKLSRFARNAREYLTIAHDLEQHNVLLASVKENIDPTTQTGKMIAGILALFAQWEAETIREQMYENKMVKWRDCRSFVGKPPYGYAWNKKKKLLEVTKKEEAIYQRIVNMYVSQKMSYKDISIQLNSEGIKCKKAGWRSANIGYMLRNPAYYGHYVVNQFLYVDDARGAGIKRTKMKKPASEMIIFPIPAIITKTRWDRVQEAINFNRNKSKRINETTSEFFLRDVLYCNRCGGRIKPRVGSKRKDGTRPRYYRCYWSDVSQRIADADRRKKCDLPYIKAKEIESAIWGDIRIMFALNQKKVFSEVFNSEKQEQRITEFEDTVNRLNSDLKHKQRTRKKLFKYLEFDNMDENELREKLIENKDEILELEANLNDAENKLKEIQSLYKQEKNVLDFLSNNKPQLNKLRRDIVKLSLQDRKTLVEAMLDGNIKVDYQEDSEEEGPGGVVADYKLKFNVEILQRFVKEGKIQLDINTSVH